MNSVLCFCNPCAGSEYLENGTCSLKPGGQCFSAIHEEFNKEDNIFETVRSYGCFSDYENAVLQCKGDLVQSKNLRSIQCCNFTDLCNKNLLPDLKPRSTIQPPNLLLQNNAILMLISLVFAFIFLSLSTALVCFKFQKQKVARKCLMEPFNIKLRKSHSMIHDLISSTGSGAGKPLLMQATIGRQIKRNHCLGRGRFTEVYVGDWNATKIVEKVFSTSEENRWLREKTVYETALLQHNNVLGFITTDILSTGLRAIYTDYHKLGSLHDYLDKTSLNPSDFFTLVETATTAVAYLHTEICGTRKRPAVVHRDINSKNFFVNIKKECVISNFEISLMHISTDGDTIMEPDITQGTPRYMAPEIVNESIQTNSFAAFKLTDIYSLGLVLYEICQRCATVESNRYTVDEHTVPFFDVLPKYPSINDMRELFATKKAKDDLLNIPQRWENDVKILKPLCQIMRECFYENAKARPNALRLKKSIMSLSRHDSKKQEDIL